MTQLNQVYKCNICGNLVQTVHAGAGQLVCCHQPMQLLQANTAEATQERLAPFSTQWRKGALVSPVRSGAGGRIQNPSRANQRPGILQSSRPLAE